MAFLDFPREVLEDIFSQFSKTALLIESIVNECLGFPPNFLKEYNDDRSWDFMVALRYFPATETESNGLTEHEDGNVITFVYQDEAGGLEVRKKGEWIRVTPAQDTLVVNVGDVIQVLGFGQPFYLLPSCICNISRIFNQTR